MAAFQIVFKNPDWDCNGKERSELTKKELDAVSVFVEWDEYITVEIDPAKMTARVVPLRELNH
jgi:sensor domain CHASE-containing protein